MYRYQRPSVRAVQPRPPLPKPQGPVHQLHLRGWKPRVDMVTRRTLGPQFFAAHTRSDRLRPDHSRGRQPNRAASTANHPRPHSVQTVRQGGRILADGHVVKNEQPGIASAPRLMLC